MGAQDAKITLTVQGGQLAADTFAKVKEAVKGTGAEVRQAGKEALGAAGMFNDMGSSFTATASDLVTHVGTMAAGFLSAEAIIGGVRAGVGALVDTLHTSIAAYAAQEKADAQLVAALRQHHLATPAVIRDYQALTSEFQKNTVFADDLIAANEVILTQVGDLMPSQMKRALEASTDLAAGLGMDLNSATMLVAKAAAGHTETLGRYGIAVSDAELKTKGFDAVLDAINRQFGGQAAVQIETYSGRVQQLANTWDNVHEAIGKILVTNPLAVKALNELNAAAEKTQAGAEASATSWGVLLHKWAGVPLTVSLAITTLEEFADAENTVEAGLTRLARMPSPFEKILKDGDPLVGMLATAHAEFAAWGKALDEQRAAQKKATAEAAADAAKLAELERQAAQAAGYHTVGVGALTSALDTFYLAEQKANQALREQVALLELGAGAAANFADKLPKNLLESRQTVPNMGALAPGLKGLGITAGHSFLDGFGDTLESIPDILMRAFEGGGGFSGAIQSLGARLGGNLAQSLGARLAKGMGGSQTEADFAKSMFSGSNLAGGLATMGISMGVQAAIHFASKIGKPSKEEVGARNAFGKSFGSVDDMLANVSQRGAAAGMDGEELRKLEQKVLDATHVSADAVNAAMDALNAKLAEGEQKSSKVKTSIDAIVQSGKAFGHALPESVKASIDALLHMKGVTDDERKALQGMLDASKPNFQALTDKAASFGISIEGLGPKFEQVQIESRSKDLTDFLTDATAAGGDVGGMLAGLSDEISSLVDDSIKFGTAIPDNMKPYIEELARAGKLTDENGKKIDDITGIKFEATPLDEGLKGLNDTIRDLIDLLSGKDGVTDAIAKTGRAADDLPDNPYANWKVPPHDGLDVGPPQDEGGHYRVTKPTLFPVALHGPEDVMFSGEGQRFAPTGSAGLPPIIVLKVEGNSPEDIYAALPDAIKHNYRGMRTRIIEAIS